MIKRSTLMLVTVLFVVTLVEGIAFADNSPQKVAMPIGQACYYVGGQKVETDVASYLDTVAGRTLVPIRFLANALGVTDDNVKYTWENGIEKVYLTKGSTKLELHIGKMYMFVNGSKKSIDVAPIIKNGRTFLPARFVAENFGYKVDYDGNTNSVVIYLGGAPMQSNYMEVGKKIHEVLNELPGDVIDVSTTTGVSSAYASSGKASSNNFTMLVQGKTENKVAKMPNEFMIAVKASDQKTLVAFKETLKILMPTNYEKAYQDYETINKSSSGTSSAIKSYDGRQYCVKNFGYAGVMVYVGGK